MQSQSLDCEPPPPPNNGSYTNLFDTSQDMPLGGSAHTMRGQIQQPALARESPKIQRPGAPPRNLYSNRPSPGRQRAAEIREPAPMATPDQFSPVTTPSPTTAAQQQAAKHHVVTSRGAINSPSMERSLAADEKYPTTQALITDKFSGLAGVGGGVGAKRSASAGSLSTVKPSYSRGVRTSPTYPPSSHHTYSNNQVPNTVAVLDTKAAVHHQLRKPHKYKESGYSSSSSTTASSNKHSELAAIAEHRVTNSQPQPQAQDLDNVPGAIRRPMSFVRALEMSDTIALQERERERERERTRQKERQKQRHDDERKNAYGSTYEISV